MFLCFSSDNNNKKNLFPQPTTETKNHHPSIHAFIHYLRKSSLTTRTIYVLALFGQLQIYILTQRHNAKRLCVLDTDSVLIPFGAAVQQINSNYALRHRRATTTTTANGCDDVDCGNERKKKINKHRMCVRASPYVYMCASVCALARVLVY